VILVLHCIYYQLHPYNINKQLSNQDLYYTRMNMKHDHFSLLCCKKFMDILDFFVFSNDHRLLRNFSGSVWRARQLTTAIYHGKLLGQFTAAIFTRLRFLYFWFLFPVFFDGPHSALRQARSLVGILKSWLRKKDYMTHVFFFQSSAIYYSCLSLNFWFPFWRIFKKIQRGMTT